MSDMNVQNLSQVNAPKLRPSKKAEKTKLPEQAPDSFEKKGFNIDDAMKTLEASKNVKGKTSVPKFGKKDLNNLKAILNDEPEKWNSVKSLASTPFLKGKTIVDCYEIETNVQLSLFRIICYDNIVNNYIANFTLYHTELMKGIKLIYDTSFKVIVTWEKNFEIFDINSTLQINSQSDTKILRYYSEVNNTLIDSTVLNNKLYLLINSTNQYSIKQMTTFESLFTITNHSIAGAIFFEFNEMEFYEAETGILGNYKFQKGAIGLFSIPYIFKDNYKEFYSLYQIRILPNRCEIYSENLLTCNKCISETKDPFENTVQKVYKFSKRYYFFYAFFG